jgi:hypothetical protein
MGNLSDLRAKAISAAKAGDWELAATSNQEIIDINSSDLSALNRLGMAQLQLKQSDEAGQTFHRVLELDSTNSIAKKQLERLSSNETFVPPTFTADAFIEEPGKAKLCQLHRLAGKDVLIQLSTGLKCLLKPKSRYISVETLDGRYVGSLPDDVSFRLSKLIAGGNTYDVLIHSVNKTDCVVFIKELIRSKANQDVSSFPIGTSATVAGDDSDQESYIFLDDENQEGRFEASDKERKEADEEEFQEETSGYTDEDIERLQ